MQQFHKKNQNNTFSGMRYVVTMNGATVALFVMKSTFFPPHANLLQYSVIAYFIRNALLNVKHAFWFFVCLFLSLFHIQF